MSSFLETRPCLIAFARCLFSGVQSVLCSIGACYIMRDGRPQTLELRHRVLSVKAHCDCRLCQKRLGTHVSVLMCGWVVMGLWLVTTTVKDAVTRSPGLSLISPYFACTSGTFMMAAVILFCSRASSASCLLQVPSTLALSPDAQRWYF